MSIHPRAALFSHAREFISRQLAGLYSWNDVVPGIDLPSELGKHGRRNPLGKWKEIVEICFGPYILRIHSPEEHGPLGLVELEFEHKLIDSGPIDQRTWDRLGAFIRDNKDQGYVGHTRRTVA